MSGTKSQPSEYFLTIKVTLIMSLFIMPYEEAV